MFLQVRLISIELCGLAQRSSSVPSAQSAYGHRFDPRRGRFNANDKNKEENLVRFLLTNLATRRLGGFGFAKTFGTDHIILLSCCFAISRQMWPKLSSPISCCTQFCPKSFGSIRPYIQGESSAWGVYHEYTNIGLWRQLDLMQH